MRIFFVHKPKRVSKKEIKRAVEFYCTLLFTPRQLDSLVFEIKFSKFPKKQYFTGQCFMVDKFEYEIELDWSFHKTTMLEMLAHELTHARQYCRRELVDVDSRTAKWKGKSYKVKHLSYWELPWEIDAYGRERGLYQRYVEKLEDHDSV